MSKTELLSIPNTWRIIKLNDLCLSISKTNINDHDENEEFKYVDINAIDNEVFKIVNPKTYLWGNAPSRAKQIIRTGDILFSTVRVYLKNLAMVTEDLDYQIASTGFCVVRPSNLMNRKYVFYYMQSDDFLQELNKLQRGSSYPAIRNSDVLNQKIPIPPSNEQDRIVQRIEELLSELEKGKEQLEKVLSQVRLYRQTLLKEAFEGKLTKDWRNEQKNLQLPEYLQFLPALKVNQQDKQGLPESWKWFFLNDVALIKGGKRLPNGHTYATKKTKYPYLRVTDFKNYSIDTSALKYINAKTRKQISDYTISISDLYISIAGTIGVVGAIPKNLDNSNLTENAAKITNISGVDYKFLMYYLSSTSAQEQISEFTVSTSQPKLPLYRIRQITVPICSTEEQQKIVEEIEFKLTLSDKVEEVISTSLEHSKSLRQDIFRKAFQGGLIQQEDQNDESSEILIQKIKSDLEIQAEQNFVREKDRTKKIEIISMTKKLKTILQLLSERQKPMSARNLWMASEHKGDIEAFYAKLKEHMDKGEIKEMPRKGKESFLTFVR